MTSELERLTLQGDAYAMWVVSEPLYMMEQLVDKHHLYYQFQAGHALLNVTLSEAPRQSPIGSPLTSIGFTKTLIRQ